MKQCIAILLVLWTASVAWCGTIASTAGGNWDDPFIWIPIGAPSITVNGAVTAITSGTVTVRGLNMTGMGPSATELDNSGVINIVSQSGSIPELIVTSVLNNSGQINMSAGQFQVGNNVGVTPWTDSTIPITASGGGTISLTGGQLVITSPLTLDGQNINGNGSGQINCPGGGMCLTVLSGNLVQANGGGLVVALSGGSINNGGILQAVNGGTLQLAGGHWSQGATNVSGGTIQALNGSTVLLGYTNPGDYDNAGSVTGSTLSTSGSGIIQASEGMVLNGITNNGNINIVNEPNVLANNNFAVLANTITNVGTINLVSGNIFLTETSTPGNTTLTGGGTVNLGGYGISGQTGNGANGTLTNVNNLIQGAGGFGAITLYNQSGGVINSNTSGQTLSITGSTINNSGILEASNGGTLQLGGGHWSGGPTYVNGGTIQALSGSTVLLGYTNPQDSDSPGTITGSTFAGSGVIKATESVVLNGITNHGTIDVVAIPGVYGGSDVILENTINNTGSITTVGGNIQLSGPVSLTGGGTVNLNGLHHIEGDPLTNVDNIIQTTQDTGWVDAQLTNEGTVRAGAGANLSVGNLTNYSGGTLTGGTYDAVGTLWIAGSISDNAATIILDGASSSVVYSYGAIDALAATFADNQAGGTFEILNGRNFTTAGAFSSEGTIDVGAGSTLTINGAFTNTGNLDINGTLIAPTINILQTLHGSGTIDGNVTVYGSTDPGNSPGILTIDGDYTQESGSFLNIQLGGTGLGEFDQLNVIGNLSLAGTLDVSLWNGFVPGNGDTFDILNWTGTRTGSFDAIDYPTLSAGYYFEPEWGDNSLTLDVGYNGTGIPEPATCFLIGAGLLVGIYGWRAKRRIG